MRCHCATTFDENLLKSTNSPALNCLICYLGLQRPHAILDPLKVPNLTKSIFFATMCGRACLLSTEM